MANFLDKVQPKNKMQLKQLVDYAFKHNIYDLNFIDTSKITDMSELFINCMHNFDVSSWDVSKVKDMHSMFYGCKKLNCDLSDWDVSFVSSDFGWTFYRCDKMTIPKWYMRIMNATKYN